jgi:hypothetical protein
MVCYRREDSAGVTGRIYDRLAQRFGKDAIFKDVDSMPLGVDFKQHLSRVVEGCAALVVVIGDRWLAASPGGRLRLDDPDDIVRCEIEAALNHGTLVIPLLVQGAQLPSEATLPASLRALTLRNGASVGHDPQLHADMARVIASLETTLRLSSAARVEPGVASHVAGGVSANRSRLTALREWLAAAALILALWLAAGLFFYTTLGESLSAGEAIVLLFASTTAVVAGRLMWRWVRELKDPRP